MSMRVEGGNQGVSGAQPNSGNDRNNRSREVAHEIAQIGVPAAAGASADRLPVVVKEEPSSEDTAVNRVRSRSLGGRPVEESSEQRSSAVSLSPEAILEGYKSFTEGYQIYRKLQEESSLRSLDEVVQFIESAVKNGFRNPKVYAFQGTLYLQMAEKSDVEQKKRLLPKAEEAFGRALVVNEGELKLVRQAKEEYPGIEIFEMPADEQTRYIGSLAKCQLELSKLGLEYSAYSEHARENFAAYVSLLHEDY